MQGIPLFSIWGPLKFGPMMCKFWTVRPQERTAVEAEGAKREREELTSAPLGVLASRVGRLSSSASHRSHRVLMLYSNY